MKMAMAVLESKIPTSGAILSVVPQSPSTLFPYFGFL